MGTIETLLGRQPAAKVPYILRPPRPGDMGWIVGRHGVRYGEDYGWDEQIEALTAEIVATFVRNYDARRERCWIAERDGENVGSVLLVKETDQVARLRLLLVEPQARGLGIGARLVDECVRFARATGYEKVTLWTHSILTAARHIYQRAGFKLVHSWSARRIRQDADRRDLGPGVANDVSDRRHHGSARKASGKSACRARAARAARGVQARPLRRRRSSGCGSAWSGSAISCPRRRAEPKVSRLDLDGVPAVHVATPQSLDDRHLLYLHGGGHMSGSPVLYRDFIWRIADRDARRASPSSTTGWRPSIRSRRRSMTPSPPTAGCCPMAPIRGAWRSPANPRAADLRSRHCCGCATKALPLPAAAVALSPWTDLALTGPSLHANAKSDPMIRSDETPRLAAQYLAGADPRTPYASPLYGDHTDLPPTLIQVGSDEVLLDDSVRMAQRLRDAGCHVEIEIWPRMPHAWQLWARIIPEANVAIARIGAFVQSKCPP